MNSFYILSAIQYDLKQVRISANLNSEIIFGYYSNLKKVYSLLSGKNVPSYSTIARKMKDRKLVSIENVMLVTEFRKIKVRGVSIRVLEVNKMYRSYKGINIEPLIISELYKNNLEKMYVQI